VSVNDFQGAGIVATALKNMLETNMPGVITALNTAYSDEYTLETPVQWLDYLIAPSSLLAGTPIVAVGEGDGASIYKDDLQTSITADHPLLVVIYHQASDRQTHAYQLRRYVQALQQTINADRLLFPASSTAENAGVWGLKLRGTQPGPLLADLDPTGEDREPRAWLSWSCVMVTAEREEVTGG